jgi:hypothetical protein
MKQRSKMIKETVVQRRMPPWSADPRYGHFKNDLRMTGDEIDLLISWIDNEAPFGDRNDLMPTPGFADGWTIGKPDVVFEMPREYTVQAEGEVKYQYFVTKTNFSRKTSISRRPKPVRAIVPPCITSSSTTAVQARFAERRCRPS